MQNFSQDMKVSFFFTNPTKEKEKHKIRIYICIYHTKNLEHKDQGNLKSVKQWGKKDGSVIKNTCTSFRVYKFGSHYPHWVTCKHL